MKKKIAPRIAKRTAANATTTVVRSNPVLLDPDDDANNVVGS